MKKKDVVSQTAELYEAIASQYFDTDFDVDLEKQRLFFMKHLKGDAVLDVGCGPGRDAKALGEEGLKVTGIDIADNFVKIAREQVPQANFMQMDVRNLLFKNNSFDGLWACASLLHLPKDEVESVINELNRVLKKGGLFFVSVKEGEGEVFVHKKKYGKHKKFFALYSKKEITALLEECGFDVIKAEIDVSNNGHWIDTFAVKK